MLVFSTRLSWIVPAVAWMYMPRLYELFTFGPPSMWLPSTSIPSRYTVWLFAVNTYSAISLPYILLLRTTNPCARVVVTR